MPSPAVQNRRSVAATQAAAPSAPRTGRVPARVFFAVSTLQAAACALYSWRARAVGAQRDVEEVKRRGHHDAGQQRRQSGAPRRAKRIWRKRPCHVEQNEQQQEDRQREGCAKQRLRRSGASAARGGRAGGACAAHCGTKRALRRACATASRSLSSRYSRALTKAQPAPESTASDARHSAASARPKGSAMAATRRAGRARAARAARGARKAERCACAALLTWQRVPVRRARPARRRRRPATAPPSAHVPVRRARHSHGRQNRVLRRCHAHRARGVRRRARRPPQPQRLAALL